METDSFEISIGDLGVQTTHYRGHTIEEVAEMATNKLISISNGADPAIKAQAHAFRDKCKIVIGFYIKEELLEGVHNFKNSGGNTFNLALYTSSATMSASTTAYSTNQEASGTNYTAKGGSLTRVDPTTSGTTAFTDFADLTFGTATITARGCMIFNDSASGDPAVAVFDFGGDKTSTAGSFTITFPTADASNAVIRIA